MDSLGEEVVKGIARGFGYIIIEFLFNFVFYYIGWPICKLFTLGAYPKKPDYDSLHTENRNGYFCSFVGCMAVMLILAFLFWN